MAKEIQTPTENATQAPEQELTGMAKMMANSRSKYGLSSEATDDEVAEAMMNGYDAEHEYAKKQRSDVERLYNASQAEPEIAPFMQAIFEGKPVDEALSYLSPLARAYMSGDIDSETLRKQSEEARTQEEKNEASRALYETMFAEFVEENPDLDGESFQKFIVELLNAIADGTMSKKTLEQLRRAMEYDTDIAAAEVKGRNANIKAKNGTHANDGIPRSASPAAGTETKTTSALDNIANRKQAMKRL